MQEEFAGVRATPEQVRDLVLREAGPAGRLRRVRRAGRATRGHRLVVLSSGFRSVIDAVLEPLGPGAPGGREPRGRVLAPRAARLVWADRGERCAVCGRRCKRHDVRARHAGETLVLIGDGVSDRCVARMAEVVFARAHLARDLAADGVPFVPFEDFHEVREALEARTTLAA